MGYILWTMAVVESGSSRAADADQLIDRRQILVARLEKVFGVFQDYGLDARLVGSLGRSASISVDPPDVDSSDRINNGIKDIDIMFMSGDRARINQALQAAKDVSAPCRVDEHFEGIVSIGQEGILLRHKSISVPVNPQVLEKREGHILGVTVPTFNPRTIFHLTEFNGLTPKMFRNHHAFLKLIKSREDLLPEEMFEPFHAVYDEQRKHYPRELTIRKIRNFYHRHVPENLRIFVSPVVRRIKEYL